jgi:hypothetical protein
MSNELSVVLIYNRIYQNDARLYKSEVRAGI